MSSTDQPPADRTTKEKLFDAAVDLFSSRGFSGVSIRDVTGAVGIKESSFYNHFKSKDELIEAIFSYYRTQFTQTLPPIERIETILSSMPPDEFLREGNRRFMQRVSSPQIRKIWRILFSEQYRDQRARDIILQEMIRLPVDYAEKVFAAMLRLGLIRPLDPKLLAAEYQYAVAFIFSTFLMLSLENEDTSWIEQELADHVAFFWNNIKK